MIRCLFATQIYHSPLSEVNCVVIVTIESEVIIAYLSAYQRMSFTEETASITTWRVDYFQAPAIVVLTYERTIVVDFP